MFFFTLKKCREDKSKPSLTYSNKLQVSDALVLIYVQITQYGYIKFELILDRRVRSERRVEKMELIKYVTMAKIFFLSSQLSSKLLSML